MSKVVIFIDAKDGKDIEIILDCESNYYGEWIKGEGADICLYRDRETHRVVGACLPCYAKSASIWTSGLDEVSLRRGEDLSEMMIKGLEEFADQLEDENDQSE